MSLGFLVRNVFLLLFFILILIAGGWASTSNIHFYLLVMCNLKSCLKVTLIFGKK